MNSPYAPPASRPTDGGITRPPKSRLWLGFGLGWAGIAFTFLWVSVALPMLAGLTAIRGNFVEGLIYLALLLAPTSALLGYFAIRREWKSVLGVLLAWASAVALLLLLVVAGLGVMGARV